VVQGEVREVFRGSGADMSILLLQCRRPGVLSYACAPSDKAMKGRRDQSFSVAGSLPSLTPNQLSISGPLQEISIAAMGH